MDVADVPVDKHEAESRRVRDAVMADMRQAYSRPVDLTDASARRLELQRLGRAFAPQIRFYGSYRMTQAQKRRAEAKALQDADRRLYEAVRELLAKHRRECAAAAATASPEAAAAVLALPDLPPWETGE